MFASSNETSKPYAQHGKSITMTTASLNNEVKDIIESNSSKYDKKKALLTIGLTEYEATLLTGECAKVRKSSSYTFGVELEKEPMG